MGDHEDYDELFDEAMGLGACALCQKEMDEARDASISAG